MKRLAACLALALAGPALAQGGPPPSGPPPSGQRQSYANPSAAIAAEIAFARLAQQKGQWTAFRETAAPDAVMFAPKMVFAQLWLKDRPNPPIPLKWRPYRAWSSCDGSLMVTTGGWNRGAEQGWFTTVWQRQPDGGYRWVFDHGDARAEPLAEPDMIEALVAECPPRPAAASKPPAPPPGKRGKPAKPKRIKPEQLVLDPAGRNGRSNDGSLTWKVSVDPGGSRRFVASMRQGGDMRDFRDEKVAQDGS